MTVAGLGLFLEVFLQVWLAALVVVIFSKVLGGQINTRGLLNWDSDKHMNSERLPVLLAAVAVPLYYAIHVMGTPLEAMKHGEQYIMPDLPDEILLLFGGSQTAYITGKAFRH